MNKEHIVKENKDFSRIIKQGKYAKNSTMVIYEMPNKVGTYRFGFSVGKKLGNAVVRNKIKRQLRNIVYKYKKNYQKSMDYIIIVRNSYIEFDFNEVENFYIELMKKLDTTYKGDIHEEKES
jgi:ribonuclease P protein component, eubacterial